MKNLFFIFKSAIDDFSRNKMRTFLTSLGILIGVFAVVVLIALGLGLKKYISDQFEAMGKDTIFLVPGKILSGGGFSGSASSFTGTFDNRDIETLKKVNNVVSVAPIALKSTKINGLLKEDFSDIMFSSESLLDVMGLEVDVGRFFDRSDVSKRAKVVVIGGKIAKDYYGNAEEAIGKKITVDDVKFTIIGVLKSKGGGGMGGPDYDSYLYGPYTTGFIFNPDKKFFRLSVKTVNENYVPQVKEDIKKEFLKRYKEEEFSIIEPTELLSAITSIFNVLNLILVAIAAISLVVGGIGIMNIMYVTVSDRIKEIGIRRAIGARKSDILSQFLAEAVLLSSIGGILGLGLAYLAVLSVQNLFPAYIDLTSVLLALGISSAIGITFGVFPARKAANLEPVEAIRYE
ncbi:ABC transporter permease [Candidatus Roizmanbacteria bacterium]|nr:ABC transporter permease [Candidatus Roizmanbacteria bacterium]